MTTTELMQSIELVKCMLITKDDQSFFMLMSDLMRRSYDISFQAGDVISVTLEVKRQIPTPPVEVWLHQSPEAMMSLKRGIAQAEAGDLHDYPSKDK